MSKILIALFAFALIGSANVPQQETDIELYVPQGTVVVATDIDAGLEKLLFSKIDPLTCHATKSVTIDYDPSMGGEILLHDTFDAGIWVVAQSTFKDGFARTVTKYENGTFAFPVEDGEVTYVGKLVLSPGASEIALPDPVSLQKYVDSTPEITSEPNIVIPWIIPYSSDELNPVLECTPAPLKIT